MEGHDHSHPEGRRHIEDKDGEEEATYKPLNKSNKTKWIRSLLL